MKLNKKENIIFSIFLFFVGAYASASWSRFYVLVITAAVFSIIRCITHLKELKISVDKFKDSNYQYLVVLEDKNGK